MKIQRAGRKFGGIHLCSSIWGAEFRKIGGLRVVGFRGSPAGPELTAFEWKEGQPAAEFPPTAGAGKGARGG